jgi:predicted dehydrogenase
VIRIGIVGSDNSHADRFSELVNLDDRTPHVDGARVDYIYGRDAARTLEVATNNRIPHIVADPREMLGHVDAVMVVFRHGGLHAGHARPFIEAGLPTFVDKPFTLDPAEAQALIDLAQARDAPLTSYSTVRWASHTGRFRERMAELGGVPAALYTSPADRQSVYGGLAFYGVHAVELMHALHGSGVQTVQAVEHDNGCMAVTARYAGGPLVTLQLLKGTATRFEMTAYGVREVAHQPLDMSDSYLNGMQVFLDMVRTGRLPLPYQEVMETVRVMDAIERSLAAGGPVAP